MKTIIISYRFQQTVFALLISILSFSQSVTGQTGNIFTETGNFTQQLRVHWNSVDWGDYDNDGDLDVLLAGGYGDYGYTFVYRNNGDGSFSEQSIGLAGSADGSAVWGDYDNDGDLDILITGLSSLPKSWSPGSVCTLIFRNNGDNSFTEQTNISLTKLDSSNAAWGDYDNDGDLDIFLSGYNNSAISKIYRNNGDNSFTEQTNISLTGVFSGSSAWGDYDNDGDLDIIIAGKNGKNGTDVSKIYRNDGNNSFTEQTNISLFGISSGTVAWGDYNNDSYLDILLTGSSVTKIYKNNGDNSFTEQTDFLLPGLTNSSAAWGDYDNDGDLDFLLTGKSASTSRIYRNNSDNSFTLLTNIPLTGVSANAIAWVDYDNDGDLDIHLTSSDMSKIYRNDLNLVKTVPDITPIGLEHSISGSTVTLKWKPVKSGTISKNAFNYNVEVFKRSYSAIIIPSHSAENGYRRMVSMGNAQLDTSFTLKNLDRSTYYWKVQAIDNSYQGGAFSIIDSFTLNAPVQANRFRASNIDGSSALLKWERGNLEKCVVFIKEGTGNFVPVKNATYSASTVFRQGTNAGDGWYCIYNGTDDNVKISGLNGLTNYTVQVFEYDGITGSEQYLTIDAVENPFTFKTNNFTIQSNISLAAVSGSYNIWGDYDNDGDLDILLTGENESEISKIYRNNGNNSFTEQTNIALRGISGGIVSWGDYDNDGDLDILLSGYNRSGTSSKIYLNNGNNSFTDQTNISFPGVIGRSVIWGDYDNDGDLDILLAGTGTSKVYQNNGNNSFTQQTSITMTGVADGSAAWGDYDNDGDLDILLTGDSGPKAVSLIYRNNGDNSFTEQTHISLPGVRCGSVDWGDYDNDGYLDILLTGSPSYRLAEFTPTTGLSKIYRNNGDNSFTEQTQISLTPVFFSSVAWGDYDNDGDLDIILAGSGITKVYRNNGDNSFTLQTDILLPGLRDCSVAWGDYDNDGDLDLLLNNQIYRNYITSKAQVQNPNKKPLSPKNLISNLNFDKMILSWEGDTTDETPLQSLSYNIAIGRTRRTLLVGAPHSSGKMRTVVGMGNTGLNNFYKLKSLNQGIYYWSVQAVDGGFKGGDWSEINAFYVQTSINGIFIDNIEYSVLPNPVHDKLTITSSNNLESQIFIYSLQGNLIKTENLIDKSINIDLSNISKGIYVLKITNNKGSVIKKIIKKSFEQ